MRFEVTSNASGTIAQSVGFDETTPPTGYNAVTADYYRDGPWLGNQYAQQSNGAKYFIVAMGRTSHAAAAGRWTRDGSNIDEFAGNNYEIRFTGTGGRALMRYFSFNVVSVPFELWNLGRDVADPTDDYRMIPWLLDNDADDVFNLGVDDGVDDGDDDKASDWIYFREPIDTSAGQAGYQKAFPDEGGFNGGEVGSEHLARIVIMSLDHDASRGTPMPEVGTTFRIVTADVFPPTASIFASRSLLDFRISVRDPSAGIGSIRIVTTENAHVSQTSFSPGVREVELVGTALAPQKSVRIVLECTDTLGNSTLHEFELPLDRIAVHDVGNVGLAVLDNSEWGTRALLGAGIPPYAAFNGSWPLTEITFAHIFAGSLLVGGVVAGEKVVSGGLYGSHDWSRLPKTTIGYESTPADQVISIRYDDSGAEVPLGLEVLQRSYQWRHANYDDFIVFTYRIKNTGLNGDLTGLTPAIFVDPDIGDEDPNTPNAWNTDRVGYDDQGEFIYQCDAFGFGGHVGLVVLGSSPQRAVGWNRRDFGDPSDDTDLYDRFLANDSGVFLPHLDEGATDKRLMTSTPSFDLKSKRQHSVAFGLAFGGTLEELRANVSAMRALYAELLDTEGNRAHKGIWADEDPQYQEDSVDGIPHSFALEQNHPNPFNPTTRIQYDVPESSRVSVTVFDMLGRRVATLFDGISQAGSHTVTFDAHSLPSGAYLLRMTTPELTFTKTMLLLK